ncbi:ATP-dependent helicase HrpB [Vibrio sinensis]|uniref:ATP-dependent helicase HrpB n=1 Tax=Vibrio sinensis TaxID=2302434 RepID=A0A3A6QZT6_9VIBR|nr:ATP-dependent helicase HrpB [Vibrio sinensis]
MSQLPIEDVLPELFSALEDASQVILKAPPGAGKSTHFPLQLLLSKSYRGKIIMLEPRRLAARNIARYLAQQLGEEVGQRVGYRVRGETKVSDKTQLEIVTEGIMTRLIQSDPELSGIDLVIFDEFHERSIHADTALAFCLEIQDAFRDDLKIVVMSATLDRSALIGLLPEAQYIESLGRCFPVEYRYAPLKANQRLTDAMARQIQSLMEQESGSLLAFLPGVAAIKQVQERLETESLGFDVCPLYGQLSFAQQQAAIQPAGIRSDGTERRKVVLATNIAETSLTIEGIRIVVDSGLERVAKFDLKSGVTKLEQLRIAQSSAEQRAGRAGRIEAGICVRLYSESQLKQQPAVPQAEILHTDLSGLALELAQWGAVNVDDLKWLDVPPQSALNQARSLLVQLELIDEAHQLTLEGGLAHQLGLEPRIAAMLVSAKNNPIWLPSALALAALLEELERNVVDFQHSVHRFIQGRHTKQKVVWQRAKQLATKLGCAFSLNQVDERYISLLLAIAYPDRIAQRRNQQAGRFLLSNGHGAELMDSERLADSDYLVAIDLMRTHQDASVIFTAAELDLQQLEQALPLRFDVTELVDWDEEKGKLVAEERTMLGKLIVRKRMLAAPPAEKMTEALLNFVRRKGLSALNWSPNSQDTLARIRCAVAWLPEQDWPAMDDAALLDELEEWLTPYLLGVNSLKSLAKIDLEAALFARLGWPLNQEINQWLPIHYVLPTGNVKRIRYQDGEEPVLSVRMQEVFGEKSSPQIALGRKTLVLELLSPAQRPLQVTRDLASFWQGSYSEVKKEMKGRYPKHVWPDDPANHVATSKTKRQLNS